MKRKRRVTRSQKLGLPPGAAVYVGEPREGGATLRAFIYDGKGVVEHQHPTPEIVHALLGPGRVVWVDCDGVHDVGLVTELCTRFGVHSLAVEDILDTEARPKLDVYDNGYAMVELNMLFTEGPQVDLCTEHVSIVLGPGFVLSFQEGRAGDLFDPVRSRIRAGTGKLRSMGADYLLHALVDAIVDGYFAVLDRIEEQIEAIELLAFDDKATDGLKGELPSRVHALKTELSSIRRTVFPTREMVGRLLKGEASLVTRSVEPYLRDVYDHIMSVLDHVDAGQERLTSVLEMHLAIAAYRMNDVMKVLTIVATVFIPLSWVAGIYGMNFDHMPELHWLLGYPLALGLMAAMTAAMMLWFRYRRWL